MTGAHELSYRGQKASELAERLVTICGVGALGSNLADTLARQGVTRLRLIDRERVEEGNRYTQCFGTAEVGRFKATAMADLLYSNVGVVAEPQSQELTKGTVKKLLRDSAVVLDCLDNSAARQLVYDHCQQQGLQCLHVGLYENYGEAVWQRDYRVPRDAEGLDICDYPLARNIVTLTVGVAAELLVQYLLTGNQRNCRITLRDLQIREF